ncbi:MAG: hypothetical protein M1837_002940 [Sclerophora amabilis]|nr:MAG: hypothetical protein M1837_002940 [Sclerophora amabilis]
MNEHLVERFGRRTVGKSERYDTPSPAPRTIGPNHLLRNYWRKEISDSSSWRSQPELPAASEIFTPKTGDGSGTGGGNSAADGDDSEEVDDDDVVGIPINKIDEPWVDKEDYLSSHYGLLREDVVAPLRDAVKEVQENPGMGENKSICIYENVHITGFTFCRQGPAARVCFSIARAGKRIRWEQSTRLRAGSVVALSPSHDNFRQHCTVAVIAARPLEGLQQNPPTVDLLFATTEEIEIDPLEKWIMVEARSVFFEANRHTLLALQRMMSETFPLANHLVDLEGDVSPPGYIQRNPFIDLRSISSEENPEAENVNVLEAFPHGLETTLDSSQLAALRRILSKRLAIVQGPPGTGKTHVSVLAVKALMEKVAETDSPLIVTAQTNHALDQLLRLIAEFEPNFIRLGSRSLDMDIIKPRTLYEVRKGRKDKNTMPKINCNLRSSAFKRIKKIEKEMKTIITPLLQEGAPCPAQVLFELGLLTESQYNSLENDTQAWVQPIREDNSFGSIATWLGGQLLPVGATTEVDTFDFEDEELDLEFEQLKELEAELSGAINDDEGGDRLQGIWLPIKEPFTSRCSPGFSEKLVSQALRVDDLYQIPPDHRGTVYCQLRKRAKKMILTNFRRKTKEYLSAAHDIRMGDLEESSALLRESRIIGMTTTGLSKNRALIASIEPKIVMVEEASETLEGHVSAACFESLEHLILVG